MKCPKCHYLSFNPEPRCRNCGYTMGLEDMDLSIAPVETQASGLADLALRLDAPAGTAATDLLGDPLESAEAARPVAPPRRRRKAPSPQLIDAAQMTPTRPSIVHPVESADVDAAVAVAPAPFALRPVAAPRRAQPAAPATSELPLFVKAFVPVEPRVDEHVEPNAPVWAPSSDAAVAADVPAQPAVLRYAPPEEPKAMPVRTEPPVVNRKLGPLDRDLLEDLQRIESNERREADAVALAARRADNVGAASRLGAAALDAILLGGLATGVLWMTLRWCDLSFGQLGTLPAAPTVTFLVLVGLGYLLLFTAAGGQTLGKMVFGIRVVGEGEPGTQPQMLSMPQAIYREILALPSILALGLGFIPALMGDERALHDRLAHTRVVRA